MQKILIIYFIFQTFYCSSIIYEKSKNNLISTQRNRETLISKESKIFIEKEEEGKFQSKQEPFKYNFKNEYPKYIDPRNSSSPKNYWRNYGRRKNGYRDREF